MVALSAAAVEASTPLNALGWYAWGNSAPRAATASANLWVDGGGGRCIRSATPLPYDPARACDSFARAYSVVNANAAASTVLVKGGHYVDVELTGNRSSRNRIVFAPAPGERVTFQGWFKIGSGAGLDGPDYLTLRNVEGVQHGEGATVPENRYGIVVLGGSSHVRLENVRAGSFGIFGSTDVAVIRGEYGPCRASVSESNQPNQGQCWSNTVDHADFGPPPRRILVDGVSFHDYDFSSNCFTPERGGTNTGTPDCHWRALYVNGVHDFTLRNSTFRDSVFAPWTTISGPAASAVGNKNVLIENNVFGTGVNYGPGAGAYDARQYGRWDSFDFAWCTNAAAGVYGYENVTYRFNSSSNAGGVSFALLDQPECSFRNVKVVGNIGLRNACIRGVIYRYNVYSNRGRCHRTDRNITRAPFRFYRNNTHTPGPRDYMLMGPRAAPDDRVPVRAGCPRRDRFGKVRGAGGFCDAGSHER